MVYRLPTKTLFTSRVLRFISSDQVLAAIMVLFAVIHLPSMNAPFFVLDDEWQLDHVKSFLHVREAFGVDFFGFWRPVKNILFLIFSFLSSFGMFWARLVAVGIGLIAIHAVHRLMKELTQSSGHAALCTALWALSPTLVSSVAWLSCTNILLMTAFACHAIRLHLKSFEEGSSSVRIWRRVGSIVLMLAGLFAYEGGIVVPALAVLIDLFLHPERLRKRNTLGLYLLYLIPILVYLSLRFTIGEPQALEAHFRNTTPAQASLSSAWFTLGHLSWWFWPFNRFAILGEYEYGMVSIHWLIAAWLFIFTACALAFFFRKTHPLAAIGWCWFLVAFSPMSNIAGLLTGPWGDYYLTLSSLGLALLFSSGIIKGLALKSVPTRFISLGIITTRLFAIHTAWLWSGYWNDPKALWEKTHLTFPESAKPLIFLAKAQLAAGQHDNAALSLENAARMDNESSLILAPKTILAIHRGDFSAAEAYALRYAQTKRDTWVLGVLGFLQEELHGDPAQAKHLYEEAVQIRPWSRESSFAAKRLALIHVQNQDLDSARHLWESVLRHNPADEDARINLGIARQAQQRQKERESSKTNSDVPPAPNAIKP
jgi:tetratricopeptide (TPR) repeat protein